MRDINIGDFVITSESKKPALVISKYNCDNIYSNHDLLLSIDEYQGDYIFKEKKYVELKKLDPEEKLSILANFGSWFYSMHKSLYQEVIIDTIMKFK